jgi:GTPase SAR1 family protein
LVLSYVIRQPVGGSYVNFLDAEELLDLCCVNKAFKKTLQSFPEVLSIVRSFFAFSVVILGAPGVGKTSLLQQGEELCQLYELQRCGCLWTVLDVQDDFQSNGRDCVGVIVMFAVTDPFSFEMMMDWMHTVLRVKELCDFPIAIVANKIDADEQQMTSAELNGKRLSNRYVGQWEMSVRTGEGVEVFWEEFGETIRTYRQEQHRHAERRKQDQQKCCIC